MATKLAGAYSDCERTVLKDCRRNSIIGGLQWGLPSLLPVWVMFKARLLPPPLAPPCYTVAFVLFSLLGSMSKNNSCIESILDMEDSELAKDLRKRLPRQAKLHDKMKARERRKLTMTSESAGAMSDHTATGSDSRTTQFEPSTQVMKDRHLHRDKGGGGKWMQGQDSKGSVRRNKYGDIVYDDVK